MFKIKKIFVSVFCILVLTMCFSGSILASAKNFHIVNDEYDIEHIDEYVEPNGCNIGLLCMTHWAAVTTKDKTHDNSYKYVSETSFRYEYGKYSSQSRQKNERAALTVSTPSSVTVNGYTQKVEYFGKMYSNASPNSDVMTTLKVRFYRSGAPLD